MALLRPFGRILAGAVLAPFAFLAVTGAFGVVEHAPPPESPVVAPAVAATPALLVWQVEHAAP